MTEREGYWVTFWGPQCHNVTCSQAIALLIPRENGEQPVVMTLACSYSMGLVATRFTPQLINKVILCTIHTSAPPPLGATPGKYKRSCSLLFVPPTMHCSADCVSNTEICTIHKTCPFLKHPSLANTANVQSKPVVSYFVWEEQTNCDKGPAFQQEILAMFLGVFHCQTSCFRKTPNFCTVQWCSFLLRFMLTKIVACNFGHVFAQDVHIVKWRDNYAPLFFTLWFHPAHHATSQIIKKATN